MECSGPAIVVFDPTLTRVRLRPHPSDVPGAGRPDHAAGRRARRARRATQASSPRRWRPTSSSPPSTTAALIEAVVRAGTDPELARAAPRARHRRQPGLRGHAPRRRPRRRRHRRGLSARSGAASRCTAPTSPAACTTRCPTGPAASASTTTSPSASSSCSTTAPSGSPTSTSTSTTATASRRSSGTTRGCSRSRCTRPARCSSPAPASRHDIGGPDARGHAPSTSRSRPGTADAGLAARLPRRRARRCCASSQPEVLVTQHGCDSHMDDPLAHLMLTVDGQRAAYLALHELAHEVARRPLGGHRRWRLRDRRRRAAGLDAPARDRRRTPARPGAGDAAGLARLRARRCSAATAPHRMTDGRTPAYRDWAAGYDPDTWLDRAIHATRMEIFPLHGLDPLP